MAGSAVVEVQAFTHLERGLVLGQVENRGIAVAFEQRADLVLAAYEAKVGKKALVAG